MAEVAAAICMQKVMRGWLVRVRVTRAEKQGRYFTATENAETLDTGKESHVSRHGYGSGAEYNGGWLGGMRHGQGTMTWPDGTTY